MWSIHTQCSLSLGLLSARRFFVQTLNKLLAVLIIYNSFFVHRLLHNVFLYTPDPLKIIILTDDDDFDSFLYSFLILFVCVSFSLLTVLSLGFICVFEFSQYLICTFQIYSYLMKVYV